MKWSIFALLISFLLTSIQAHGADCDVSSFSTAIGAANGTNCTVSGSQSTIQLNFIGGFNSTAALSAVGGNGGTTLGAQRMLSFIKAAETIADQVKSNQTIIIDANFEALTCDATSATLGSAGASVSQYHPAPPAGITADTWYPIGLYNHISNADNFSSADDVAGAYTGNGTGSDIKSKFNSNIGTTDCLESSSGWYYGFNETPSASYIGFTTVLLHEITHGLGFSSLVSSYSGAKSSGKNDVYSNHLYDATNGAWNSLTDAQRADSVVSVTGLLWTGTNVNAQAIGVLTDGFQNNTGPTNSFEDTDKVEMYAPCLTPSGNPQYDYVSGDCLYKSGSSVSHFNTDAAPNELMEPNYTEYMDTLGLALFLLQDIGWTISAPSNTAPSLDPIGNQTTNEDSVKNITLSGTDPESNPLTYSVTSCPTDITCNVSGTSLTLTPASNYNGVTNSVTVQVTDGSLTDSETFNLDVQAINDAPIINALSNINLMDGSNTNISLSGSDIEGHTLTYTDTACGASLSCNVTGTTLNVAASGGVGSSPTVTIQVSDGNGGTDNTSFDVLITSSTPSTTVNIGGGEINNGETLDLGLGSGQIDVNNGSGNYSYSLDYNNSDVSSLITTNGTGLTLGLPSSGGFAGDYTLTITDNGDGDVISITIKRPLRLVWSATSILEGDTAQTLKIEGGAHGTVYSLSEIAGSELIFKNNLGTVISNSSADNANDFNAASVYLSTESVSGINPLDVEVRVSSTYDDVDETVQVVPAISHDFTVEGSNGTAINNAKLSLNGGESILNNMNLEADYYSNASGLVTIELPDTGDSLALTTTASGYTADNLSVDNGITTHTITLTEMANGVTVTGAISALGTQDFTAHPPTVLITYSDGSSDTVPVTVSSVSQANFTHSVDINLKSMSSMEVKQEDSLSINVSMSNVQQNQSYNILLERHVAVVSVGSGGGGGSLPWYTLLLLPFLIRFKRAKT